MFQSTGSVKINVRLVQFGGFKCKEMLFINNTLSQFEKYHEINPGLTKTRSSYCDVLIGMPNR